MNCSSILIEVLTNPKTCLDSKYLPKNDKKWIEFIDLALRNKITFCLSHFLTCKKCQKFLSKSIKNKIGNIHNFTLLKWESYQKIKRLLKKYISKTGTTFIILKDTDHLKRKKTPTDIPLKFDIDIMGRYTDLPNFEKYLKNLSYIPQIKPTGWPDLPINEYTQIKFNFSENNSFYPQIEFRFQAITIPEENKMPVLTKEDFQKLTEELWQNIEISKNNFSPLSIEYQFILLCIIFYFEDNCKGLHNLYRIWLFFSKEKKRLNWKKVAEIAKRYKVSTIISFVLTLAEREFSSYQEDPYVSSRLNLYPRQALRLIDLNYICRANLRYDKKDFRQWMDGYIYFLTRGLLIEERIWRKILFFLHPKRVIYLLLSNIKFI